MSFIAKETSYLQKKKKLFSWRDSMRLEQKYKISKQRFINFIAYYLPLWDSPLFLPNSTGLRRNVSKSATLSIRESCYKKTVRCLKFKKFTVTGLKELIYL